MTSEQTFEEFLDTLGSNQWLLKDAVTLCKLVELICPQFGCHVALTGGSLYKEGERKDCDLLFYRIRQVPAIDMAGLLVALHRIGVSHVAGSGWCFKAKYRGKNVDMLFPEAVGGDYVP